MESMARPANGHDHQGMIKGKVNQGCKGHFEMPLHYPRYNRSDYETMPEWRIDCLLAQYGLPVSGDVHQKRKFAMGAFLWSSNF